MKAWIDFIPWQRRYEVRLAKEAGPKIFAAAKIEDRQIVWEEQHERDEVEPVLYLEPFAFEALMRAAGEYTSTSDATVQHLKDSNVVRDRLLTLVEAAWGSR